MDTNEKPRRIIVILFKIVCFIAAACFFGQLLLSNMGELVWLDLTCGIVTLLSMGAAFFLLAWGAWPTENRPWGLVYIPIGCVFLAFSFMLAKDLTLDLIEGPQTAVVTNLHISKSSAGRRTRYYLQGTTGDGELMRFSISYLDYTNCKDQYMEPVATNVVYYVRSSRIIELTDADTE